MEKSNFENKDDSRLVYLDILRIISIFGVLTIHTSCQVINSSVFKMPPIGSMNWNVAAIYNSLSRFSVPVFLMISGALFIGRDLSISLLYKKYVARLLASYLVWSFFYSIVKNHSQIKDIIWQTLIGAPRFGFILYISSSLA